MKQENKEVAEFGIGDLDGVAITIAIAVLVVAFVLGALVETRDDFTANSSEFNATNEGITALSKIPTKMGLLVTIVLIVVVIGALSMLRRG